MPNGAFAGLAVRFNALCGSAGGFDPPAPLPEFDPATIETNVPGLYFAGTVAAGIQQRGTFFTENYHEHAGQIAAAITGHWPRHLRDTAGRNYALELEKIEVN